MLLQSPIMLDSLASSIHGGGLSRLRRVVNIYVDRFYNCDHPEQDIIQSLREWRYPIDTTAGLLTAVQLQHTSVLEEQGEHASIFCCSTAGISNAARAGAERTTFAAYKPGTINTILAINGRLTQSAMVNAMITAVEAKAAALADLDVRDPDNGRVATGTTTDAIILCVSQNKDYPVEHHYAGTATDLGAAIGRTVYGTVTEGLLAAWKERKA
ncbi:hypothetical protein JCM16418_25 [Paenibacillus pini JCM 16418]|uniref:Adenosylcobinamide amidohydrolase n=2 Tax=Paenibacillus TaxID=44249 RepID=W7YF33_9BACL|nr:hypothetical protein JCM16418_25 [Paenibacillus pini JCM 16418]